MSWVLSAVTLIVVSWILPGLTITGFFGALLAAAVIAALNALLPPIVAGLRLPYTVGLSFVLILILDALLLMLAAEIAPDALSVDNFWWALLAALLMSAVGMILAVATGTNEDDTYTLRLAQRIARRTGGAIHTDVPGIIFLEIDGLALPVLRRAMRDGNAPQMARWLADDTHRLVAVGDRPVLADRRQPGGDPAGLQRRHPRVPLGGEGDRPPDDLLGAGATAPRSSAAAAPATACWWTAARAGATCCRARPTRSSSPSAGWTPTRRPTPATGPSSPTA